MNNKLSKYKNKLRGEEERKCKIKEGTDGKFELGKIGLKEEVLFFENSKWLRTEETAKYLRTSPAQIRNWVYQGRLKAYRLLGRSLRFKRSDLDLLIEEGGVRWE